MESKQLKSFKDLLVWQKAADLATIIYRLTEKFPQSELYGLTNQMRRSAVSISSNVAEGFKRNHKKEKLQFYNIAYGSAAEIESQIEISLKLNFLNHQEYSKLNNIVSEISKMMDGLIRSVSRNTKSHILNSLFLFTFLYSIFYILNPLPVQGAELYFGINSKEIGAGEKFKVGVFLNSQSDSINAVHGNIVFDPKLIEFQEIQNGGSILNLWVKQPYILSEGKLTFSGVAPGGFEGNKGYLFSIIFKAKKTGKASISSSDEKILLNDGTGLKAGITKAPLSFNITEKSSPEEFIPLYDPDPPEPFAPQIVKDENLFSGKWFLIFNTQDKGLGIDYYEVLEKPQKNSFFAPPFYREEKWVKAESPYLLKDQSLQSVILVKAVDRAGNGRIEALEPLNKLSWYKNFWIWIIIIVSAIFLLAVFIIRKILWKVKH